MVKFVKKLRVWDVLCAILLLFAGAMIAAKEPTDALIGVIVGFGVEFFGRRQDRRHAVGSAEMDAETNSAEVAARSNVASAA